MWQPSLIFCLLSRFQDLYERQNLRRLQIFDHGTCARGRDLGIFRSLKKIIDSPFVPFEDGFQGT